MLFFLPDLFSPPLHTAPWACGGECPRPATEGSQTDSRLNEVLVVPLGSVVQSQSHGPLSDGRQAVKASQSQSATTDSEFTKSLADWFSASLLEVLLLILAAFGITPSCPSKGSFFHAHVTRVFLHVHRYAQVKTELNRNIHCRG